MSTSRKITLKSSDGEAIEVDEAVALESQMIKHIIKDDCADNEILLPEVTSKILSKVIEYCKKHVESPKSDDCATGAVDDDLRAWDAAFVKVDKDSLFDLILAAKYLNIKSLLDLTRRTVLCLTEGKTVEEMNKWYIEVDPENQWPSGKKRKSRRMSTSRKITLESSDGEAIEVDEAVALELQMIKHIIKDDCADNEILLPEVTSKILSKVIEYCKKHVESPKSDDCATSAVDDDLKAWDAAFVKVDKDTLFDLILAAKYLNIKSLLDLTCRTVLDLTKGKTVKEMSKWYIEVDPENQ